MRRRRSLGREIGQGLDGELSAVGTEPAPTVPVGLGEGVVDSVGVVLVDGLDVGFEVGLALGVMPDEPVGDGVVPPLGVALGDAEGWPGDGAGCFDPL